MLQKKQHDLLIQSILHITAGEKILLIAATRTHTETDSVFYEDISGVQSIHHFLLVLIPKEHNADYRAIQREAEELCENEVTVLAMEMEMFNAWLATGHPFAVPVKAKAELIFDAGVIPFAIPIPVDTILLKTNNKKWYHDGIEQMQVLTREHRMPDAVVAGLQTLLKTAAGIELDSKDPDELMRYCRIFFKETIDIANLPLAQLAKRLEALLQLQYLR